MFFFFFVADKYNVASKQCNKAIDNDAMAGTASDKSGKDGAKRRRKRPQRFESSSDEDNPQPVKRQASPKNHISSDSDETGIIGNIQARVQAALKAQKSKCNRLSKDKVTKKLFQSGV